MAGGSLKQKSILIGGIEYPFFYDLNAIKMTQVRGQYAGDQQMILLDTKLPRATLLRTILHESMHGVFEKSTLCAGPEKDRDIPPELEEKLCQMLEAEIPALFRANPWLKEVLK